MLKRRPFEFRYQFQFMDGHVKDYAIALDPETLSLFPVAAITSPPDWIKLSYQQCKQCPLSVDVHPYCPIAVNIMELVEAFKSVFSYHDCNVVCSTTERSYSKETSVMEGLSAIFGVIMATSDCPVMEFLKPMARFHLPFATIEETTVRTASMYLLAQYFKYKDSPGMRFDFKSLERHYSKVQLVNEGLLNRINSVGSEDADKNAIVTLHSLSSFLSMEIDYSLSGLEYIFSGRYAD
ncbi:MAG: hypothetical protein HKP58_14865 [Desulfatitalea sp.]|nr:hypothetical protein [Desulfatitalea sp.]NNK01689.1 hypothetical protein [Desulfatitalea sp.]